MSGLARHTLASITSILFTPLATMLPSAFILKLLASVNVVLTTPFFFDGFKEAIVPNPVHVEVVDKPLAVPNSPRLGGCRGRHLRLFVEHGTSQSAPAS